MIVISELQLVMLVILAGWAGIFYYLVRIDQRLANLEKEQVEKDLDEPMH